MPPDLSNSFRLKIHSRRDFHLKEDFVGDSNGWRTRERFWTDVEVQVNNANEKFPNGIVPILANRNYETVVGMVAALIADKSFASLDPAQPRERLEACLNQIGYGPSLIPQNFGKDANWPSAQVLQSSEPSHNSSDSLSYILFTSGSTGVPKGVQISDSNLENTILWGHEIFSWGEDEIIGIVANPFFDLAIFDIFTSVYFGIRMFYLTDPANVDLTLEEIHTHGITTLFSAPVFFSQVVRSGAVTDPRLSRLRRIISGGDFFPAPHILTWRQSWTDLQIYNIWGPTETTIVNSAHLIDQNDEIRLRDGKSPPIGKATKRMHIEVQDEMGFRVPDGVEGELVVYGESVGLGYLSQSEVKDSGYFESGPTRFFRTKDLGFQDERGLIYMTGRSGFMAKVNGFRVDLREIESQCLQLNGIANCLAYPHQLHDGIHQLTIFVEKLALSETPSLAKIRTALRDKLPSYMVPKKVIYLDEFPTTRNGKVDRKKIISNYLEKLG